MYTNFQNYSTTSSSAAAAPAATASSSNDTWTGGGVEDLSREVLKRGRLFVLLDYPLHIVHTLLIAVATRQG